MIYDKESFMVVIKAEKPEEFARDVAEAQSKGYLPIAGQWAFYENGSHVAYYVNMEKTAGAFKATPAGDHAEPVQPAAVGGAEPASVAVADLGSPEDWEGIPAPPEGIVDAHPVAAKASNDVDRSYT